MEAVSSESLLVRALVCLVTVSRLYDCMLTSSEGHRALRSEKDNVSCVKLQARLL